MSEVLDVNDLEEFSSMVPSGWTIVEERDTIGNFGWPGNTYASIRTGPLWRVAEEEGFYFAQYEGGIRWHTLVRYTESAANKQFTFCPRKHWLPSSSNSVSFCSARIAAWGVHSALTNQAYLPAPAGTWVPYEEPS